MKINGTGTGSTEKAGGAAGVNPLEGTRDKAKKTKLDNIEAPANDKVSISARAKDTAKAQELAKAAPDVNDDKVERLKSAIQNRTYNVSADKIADKLVDEHLFNGI